LSRTSSPDCPVCMGCGGLWIDILVWCNGVLCSWTDGFAEEDLGSTDMKT